MEANVYRFYKWSEKKNGKIHVEYEPKIFPLNPNSIYPGHYIPDFKITTKSSVWYIEVKGVLDRDAIKKARAVTKNNSWIKLYFIFPKQYHLIEKYYGHLIPGWEW